MPPHRSTSIDGTGFAARLGEVAAFKNAHGRLPRPSGANTLPGELALGGWLRRTQRRHVRRPLPGHQQHALDLALGPWCVLTPAAADRAERRVRPVPAPGPAKYDGATVRRQSPVWTREEEQLAAREDLDIRQIAQLTGRTAQAVRARRAMLRTWARPIR